MLFLLCLLEKRAQSTRWAHRISPPQITYGGKIHLGYYSPRCSYFPCIFLWHLSSHKTGICTSMKLILSSLSQVCIFLLNTTLQFPTASYPVGGHPHNDVKNLTYFCSIERKPPFVTEPESSSTLPPLILSLGESILGLLTRKSRPCSPLAQHCWAVVLFQLTSPVLQCGP